MDTLGDLLDVLPVEEYYGPEIPAADYNCIEKLPLELLQAIANYCSNRTMLALMRVDRVFHSVALRKFYSQVHITCSRYAKALEGMDTALSIEEILPSFYKAMFGVISGLLQRQEHLDNLRVLHVVDFPLPQGRGCIIYHKILRYIMEKATCIQRIELPWSNGMRGEGFNGLVISPSLNAVKSPMIQTPIVTSILRAARLQTLDIAFQCASHSMLQELLGPMTPSLKHLRCAVHITKSDWEEASVKLDAFLATLKGLETLEYGFCTCTSSTTPQPEVPTHSYARVVKELPNLTSVVILDRRHTPPPENVQNDEQAIVIALSEANENLQCLAVEYLHFTLRNGSHISKWIGPKPCGLDLDSKQTNSIWTPDPSLVDRWGYWFNNFRRPALVQEEMQRQWGIGSVPCLWDLEWYYQYTQHYIG